MPPKQKQVASREGGGTKRRLKIGSSSSESEVSEGEEDRRIAMELAKPRSTRQSARTCMLRNRDSSLLEQEMKKQEKPKKKMIDFDYQELLSDPAYEKPELYRAMKPEDFNMDYYNRTGLNEVLKFNCPPAELGMKMVDDDFSVNDVEKLVGGNRIITVVVVATQDSVDMPLKDFIDYYKGRQTPGTSKDEKKTLYNVLSLEFSNTALTDLVQSPSLVRQIDWASSWPDERKLRVVTFEEDGTFRVQNEYPRVENYCLMSPTECYTDFHIDFHGTSVWYHVKRGKKVFWIIEPTEQNLKMYEEYLKNTETSAFFGTIVEKCARVEVLPGNTLIIPSGWIHAVYTPVDSLVFGGNFLHSRAALMQLNVLQGENRIGINKKYRYPYSEEAVFFCLNKIVKEVTGRDYIRPASRNQQDAWREYVGDLFRERNMHHRVPLKVDYLDESPLWRIDWDETNEYNECVIKLAKWDDEKKEEEKKEEEVASDDKKEEEKEEGNDEKKEEGDDMPVLSPKKEGEEKEKEKKVKEEEESGFGGHDDLFVDEFTFYHPVTFNMDGGRGATAIHTLPLSSAEPPLKKIDRAALIEAIHVKEVEQWEGVMFSFLKKTKVDLPIGLTRPNSLIQAFCTLLRIRRLLAEQEGVQLAPCILPDKEGSKRLHEEQTRAAAERKRKLLEKRMKIEEGDGAEDSDWEEQPKKKVSRKSAEEVGKMVSSTPKEAKSQKGKIPWNVGQYLWFKDEAQAEMREEYRKKYGGTGARDMMRKEVYKNLPDAEKKYWTAKGKAKIEEDEKKEKELAIQKELNILSPVSTPLPPSNESTPITPIPVTPITRPKRIKSAKVTRFDPSPSTCKSDPLDDPSMEMEEESVTPSIPSTPSTVPSTSTPSDPPPISTPTTTPSIPLPSKTESTRRVAGEKDVVKKGREKKIEPNTSPALEADEKREKELAIQKEFTIQPIDLPPIQAIIEREARDLEKVLTGMRNEHKKSQPLATFAPIETHLTQHWRTMHPDRKKALLAKFNPDVRKESPPQANPINTQQNELVRRQQWNQPNQMQASNQVRVVSANSLDVYRAMKQKFGSEGRLKAERSEPLKINNEISACIIKSLESKDGKFPKLIDFLNTVVFAEEHKNRILEDKLIGIKNDLSARYNTTVDVNLIKDHLRFLKNRVYSSTKTHSQGSETQFLWSVKKVAQALLFTQPLPDGPPMLNVISVKPINASLNIAQTQKAPPSIVVEKETDGMIGVKPLMSPPSTIVVVEEKKEEVEVKEEEKEEEIEKGENENGEQKQLEMQSDFHEACAEPKPPEEEEEEMRGRERVESTSSDRRSSSLLSPSIPIPSNTPSSPKKAERIVRMPTKRRMSTKKVKDEIEETDDIDVVNSPVSRVKANSLKEKEEEDTDDGFGSNEDWGSEGCGRKSMREDQWSAMKNAQLSVVVKRYTDNPEDWTPFDAYLRRKYESLSESYEEAPSNALALKIKRLHWDPMVREGETRQWEEYAVRFRAEGKRRVYWNSKTVVEQDDRIVVDKGLNVLPLGGEVKSDQAQAGFESEGELVIKNEDEYLDDDEEIVNPQEDKDEEMIDVEGMEDETPMGGMGVTEPGETMTDEGVADEVASPAKKKGKGGRPKKEPVSEKKKKEKRGENEDFMHTGSTPRGKGKKAKPDPNKPLIIDGVPVNPLAEPAVANAYGYDPAKDIVPLGQGQLKSAYRRSKAQLDTPQMDAKRYKLEVKHDHLLDDDDHDDTHRDETEGVEGGFPLPTTPHRGEMMEEINVQIGRDGPSSHSVTTPSPGPSEHPSPFHQRSSSFNRRPVQSAQQTPPLIPHAPSPLASRRISGAATDGWGGSSGGRRRSDGERRDRPSGGRSPLRKPSSSHYSPADLAPPPPPPSNPSATPLTPHTPTTPSTPAPSNAASVSSSKQSRLSQAEQFTMAAPKVIEAPKLATPILPTPQSSTSEVSVVPQSNSVRGEDPLPVDVWCAQMERFTAELERANSIMGSTSTNGN